MEAQFETLPFAGEFTSEYQSEFDSEMAFERGRSGGRSSSRSFPRPTRPISRPMRRPVQPGPPLRPPSYASPVPRRPRGWGPWSYPVFPALPYPAVPDFQPEPMPVFDSARTDDPSSDADADVDAPAADAPEDETSQSAPPIVTRAIGQLVKARKLSAAAAPRYMRLDTLDKAINFPEANRPGLYLIEFSSGRTRQAYSGQGGSIRARLLDHLRTLKRWGVDPGRYMVYVAVNSALFGAEASRRKLESDLHDAVFGIRRSYLTNRQREMEFADPGFR